MGCSRRYAHMDDGVFTHYLEGLTGSTGTFCSARPLTPLYQGLEAVDKGYEISVRLHKSDKTLCFTYCYYYAIDGILCEVLCHNSSWYRLQHGFGRS